MNFLFLLVSLIFSKIVLSSGVVVVTVTHPHPITVTYDPIAGRIIPPSPASGEGNYNNGNNEVTENFDDKFIDKIFESNDLNGKVNAKATIASSTGTKTTSMRSTSIKSSTGMSTDATTDSNSAFRMSLPFAFGTAAAVILAAIVF